jgi:hypothetical protein
MIRYERLGIPDAYIIDELAEQKQGLHDLPLESPYNSYEYEAWPERLEEADECQSHVIIIEI